MGDDRPWEVDAAGPPPRREDTEEIPPPPAAREGWPPGSWATTAAGPPPRARPGPGVVALVVAALVVVGLAVANAVVARNAEARAEERATAAVGAPVDVDLQGFPVGLRLLVGSPLDARLTAREVPLEGAPAALTQLRVDATDVVLERGPAGDAIRAGEATFVAELDDEAVEGMLGLIGRIPLTDVTLANGVASLSVAGFTLLDATAEVEAGQVVFRVAAPIGNLADVRLELDALPLGFEADDVEIRPGVLRLRGSATDVLLEGDP